jgi:hypothetical protein
LDQDGCHSSDPNLLRYPLAAPVVLAALAVLLQPHSAKPLLPLVAESAAAESVAA